MLQPWLDHATPRVCRRRRARRCHAEQRAVGQKTMLSKSFDAQRARRRSQPAERGVNGRNGIKIDGASAPSDP